MTTRASRRDLVWGACGIKIYAQTGVSRALELLRVPTGTETGVSAGASTATLRQNNYTWDRQLAVLKQARSKAGNPFFLVDAVNSTLTQQVEIFRKAQGQVQNPIFWLQAISETWTHRLELLKEATQQAGSSLFWADAFIVPTAEQWSISPTCISLEKIWQRQVEELKLEWTDQLQTVSYGWKSGKLICHRKGADLGSAVAASGSLPPLFAPVYMNGEPQVDGAVGHYNPTCFSGPAIVVRLDEASQPSKEVLSPVDSFYHNREVRGLSNASGSTAVDENVHIVIDVKIPDVSGLSFGLSEKRCLEMHEIGFETARTRLLEARKQGLIEF